MDAVNNKVASSIKLFDIASEELPNTNFGKISSSNQSDIESTVISDDKVSLKGSYFPFYLIHYNWLYFLVQELNSAY